jgi:hypothetical protein
MECDACGEWRSDDELGTCPTCGARVCGIGECTGKCTCDSVPQTD